MLFVAISSLIQYICISLFPGYIFPGGEAPVKYARRGDKLNKSWDSYDSDAMYEYLDCEKLFNTTRPICDKSCWKRLRAKYQKEVGITSFPMIDPHPPPWYVGQTLDKGRGVFASRDIEEDELVYNGTSYFGLFQDGASWRNFVMSAPDEMSCDIFEWSWVQDLGENTTLAIILGVDDSSILNDGQPGYLGDDNESNLSCGLEGESCRDQYYATRKVFAGEEILADYSHFTNNNWKPFGL